ncbi:MAG: ABC transporter permease, partial [Gemmatimonadetes bacterium]|nr:ABC transporter permease [Gemmatimonadota bacterium]
MLAFLMDLRFALRTLRKGWWVTAIALISLAVAIGGNATVFSLVNGLMFRPLPYDSPERLVLFDEDERDQTSGQGAVSTSLATFADISERSRTTTAWGAFRPRPLSVRGTERADAVGGAVVSTGFFELLGVSPTHGRVFRPEEGVEGGPRVVILHHDYWVNSLGMEEEPVGTVLTLDGEPHEVIGVLPEGFDFIVPNVDLWLPLTTSPRSEPRDRRDVIALGRMSPTATMEQVRAEVALIGDQLEAEYSETQEGWILDVLNLRYDFPSQNSRTLLWLLQGSVLSVLLIACVNITNLLLARGQERKQEIALRTALGAGRGRIIRQLLTESSLLTLAGTGGGLVLGWYGIQILANRFAPIFATAYVPVLDLSVVGFTVAISVLAGLIFGVTPAIQAFRRGHTDALKEGGQRGSSGGSRKRMSRILVVCELVLSLLALGGGGMLVRSFRQLQNVEAGFDRSNLLTAQVTVPTGRYTTDEEALILLDGILEESRGVPGIRAAALVSALPMGFGTPEDTFRIESGNVDFGENAPSALILNASPEYRETIDLVLLEGRFFSQSDRIG